MRIETKLMAAGLLVLLTAGWCDAQDWGYLRGQFVFDGDPPAPQKLTITKDQEECCKHNLVDESLTVNPTGRGLKNVAIYLAPARNEQLLIHPNYVANEGTAQKIDNNACRFDPRVVLLWTKQALVIENTDPIGHNAMIDTQKNPPINVTIPSGGSLQKSFSEEERLPVPVSCSIHPWMRGWLLIRATPYMAVTDDQGKFEIKDIPAGTWEFVFWHERATYLTDVIVDGKPTQWRRGRTSIAIQSGGVDLGVIKVAAEHFK